MCVIAFTWNAHPRWRLLLVGNRDEAHARPSAPLARWADDPRVIAGRDLEAGGTWMGIDGHGRVAVVTNVRDPHAGQDGASRGGLVTGFLRDAGTAPQQASALALEALRFHPFNLLLFDRDAACFVSNHPRVRVRAIAPGLHGLSNGDLDGSWPKVRRATAALGSWLATDATAIGSLLDAFADATPAADADLPDTGVGLALERRLSPLFVRGTDYGTRATTVIGIEHGGGGRIIERRFGPAGAVQGQTALRV